MMIRVVRVTLCNFPLASAAASGVPHLAVALPSLPVLRVRSCRQCSCNHAPEDQDRQAVHIDSFGETCYRPAATAANNLQKRIYITA